MLEALNAATADTHEHLLDVTAFEAFKPVTKERDYPETQVIKEDDSLLLFRSVTPDATRLVKIWYGITPDVARQDRSLRLLSFLERCRVLKGVGLDGVQTIVDFGLTRRSLLLVLDWVEGTALQDWINENPTLDARLSTGTALANTVNRLHALELAHGDIHPGNVIVRPDGTPVLIDAADLRISSTDAYTTAYLPDNYETRSLRSRGCTS
jgi:serine/threonine protein kinase